MTAAEKRLQAIRDLLAHVRDRLGLEMGFVLWDGSTIPADLPPNALAIMIADEGAIAALIRRPKLDILLNLFVSARIDTAQRHDLRPDGAAAGRPARSTRSRRLTRR